MVIYIELYITRLYIGCIDWMIKNKNKKEFSVIDICSMFYGKGYMNSLEMVSAKTENLTNLADSKLDSKT